LTRGICKPFEPPKIEKKKHMEQLKKVYSVRLRNVPDTATSTLPRAVEDPIVLEPFKQDWEKEADSLVEWSKDLPNEVIIE
jgi:hypothetical protein